MGGEMISPFRQRNQCGCPSGEDCEHSVALFVACQLYGATTAGEYVWRIKKT